MIIDVNKKSDPKWKNYDEFLLNYSQYLFLPGLDYYIQNKQNAKHFSYFIAKSDRICSFIEWMKYLKIALHLVEDWHGLDTYKTKIAVVYQKQFVTRIFLSPTMYEQMQKTDSIGLDGPIFNGPKLLYGKTIEPKIWPRYFPNGYQYPMTFCIESKENKR